MEDEVGPDQGGFDDLWRRTWELGIERSALLDDALRYTTPPDERPLARVLPFRPKEEPKR